MPSLSVAPPAGSFRFVITLALGLVIAACAPPEPIKIGFVGGLSGRVADLGISGRNGAQLAVEHWNQQGGLNGRQIQLLARDDKQNGTVAQAVVTELINAGVAVIIGHMTSSMSMETVPLVNRHKVVMLSPTTTTDALEHKDDYFFRVIATTRHYAGKHAEYQYREMGLRRVAAVLDTGNSAYTESWLKNFEAAFTELGGSIVLKQAFRSSPNVDFAEIATQLLAASPDGILILANSLDAALISQQVRKLNREVSLAASEWAATERLIELGGKAVEGIIIAQFFDRYSQDTGYLKFRQDYQQRFGREPGFGSIAAYDATQVAISALAKANGGQLKQVLLNIARFPGLQGPVSLDKYGDSSRETHLATISDGRYQLIK